MNYAMAIAVVDTGSGNLRSVEKALQAAGGTVVVTSDPEQVARADKLVVPGQGAFGGCMRGLERAGGGLLQAVQEAITRGRLFFGICLGLQILFDASDESPECAGLGIVPGRVRRFCVPPPLKIPHMGWNTCDFGPAANATPILRGIVPGTSFYFVHSYYAVPFDATQVALFSEHGVRFCAAIARDNLFACQFHPEKSQAAGLRLLSNFVAE